MKIRDLMSKDIVSISTNDTVQKAATLMKQHDIGSIPVCEQTNVVGIITDRDIAIRSVAEGKDAKNQVVTEVMSTNPITCNSEMSVEEVSKIMGKQQIRRIPVIDDNHLVGVVALGDLATEPRSDEKAGHALSGISESDRRSY